MASEKVKQSNNFIFFPDALNVNVRNVEYILDVFQNHIEKKDTIIYLSHISRRLCLWHRGWSTFVQHQKHYVKIK